MLPAPLSLDVSLGLVGVFFERFHGTLHFPFLGGHRAQSPTNRESRENFLIVNMGSVLVLGHEEIIAQVRQLESGIFRVLVVLRTDRRWSD